MGVTLRSYFLQMNSNLEVAQQLHLFPTLSAGGHQQGLADTVLHYCGLLLCVWRQLHGDVPERGAAVCGAPL